MAPVEALPHPGLLLTSRLTPLRKQGLPPDAISGNKLKRSLVSKERLQLLRTILTSDPWNVLNDQRRIDLCGEIA